MEAQAPTSAGKPDSKEELISLRIVQLATDKGGTLTNEDLQVGPIYRYSGYKLLITIISISRPTSRR